VVIVGAGAVTPTTASLLARGPRLDIAINDLAKAARPSGRRVPGRCSIN
jgi:2-polyprenyl-6-methoxyphenol hydroxylase-like FAD-dependent oxidoreductase